MPTDPLSGFTSLIRTLWRARAERGAKTADAGARAGGPEAIEPPASRDEELRERLHARLGALRAATAARRREAFVETVLQWEFRDGAGADPRFTELVGRVADELAADGRVAARLDELLLEL